MKDLKDVVAFLDDTLNVGDFIKDPASNGLQVESGKRVQRVIFGVDASEALFRVAMQMNADLVISHHGLIWGSGLRSITGLLGTRIKLLMQNNISLYAAHLPLDAHPLYGNNIQLAKMIKLQKIEPFFEYSSSKIGVIGMLRSEKMVADLLAHFELILSCKGHIYGNETMQCKRIGIISGGAGVSAVECALKSGCDCLVTGAFEHEMWHLVQESNLSVIALGHYATERCGLQALMKKVEDELALECHFVEIKTEL